MAEIIQMPKMSDTMSEGVISKWHKKVGDTVKSGELMAEIETDKATMDFESFSSGSVLYLGAKEGEAVKVNDLLAIIGKSGEDFSSLLSSHQQGGKDDVKPIAKKEEPSDNKPTAVNGNLNVKAEMVLMPKMSDTMTEGKIAKWHKKVGDKVKSGELLADIETDKATMEYESYNTGTLLYIGAKVNETIKVDEVLAIVGDKDADWNALLQNRKVGEVKRETAVSEKKLEVAQSKPAETNSTGRVKISPLAKKMAKEMGYDISSIKGSGEQGRIIKRDIDSFKPSATQPSALVSKKSAQSLQPQVENSWFQESYEDLPVDQMRKTIARRLSESKFGAPHFYLTMEIDMDKVIEMRKGINETSLVKISFNDIIIKAIATSLRSNLDVNVSWLGDKIRKNHHIHIGVAVALPEGLIVPVVRFADCKSLTQIAVEVKEMAEKAKQKKLQPTDWEGNTFTISNLGMYGIEEFTAIINPPDACILAIGGIKEIAKVKGGQLAVGSVMKVTLSCDHRAVDGAIGAKFLKTLKELLEEPIRIFI